MSHNVSVPKSFVQGTASSADDVNSNFTALVNYINARNGGTEGWDSFILYDASAAFKITIVAATSAAIRTYTIPDAGLDAKFVLTESAQTVNGVLTFPNGFKLKATNNATITVATLAADRAITLPDPGGAASFVMTAGVQTIAGAKTFSSAVVVGGNTTGDSNLGTISSVSLGNYYEGTFSATFTGPFNSGALTINYTRIGRNVTLVVPSFSGTSASATTFSASAAIPSSLRPTTTQFFLVQIKDNSAASASPGLLSVSSAGTITIFKSDASNSFTGSGTAGLDLTTAITYTMV